MVIEVIVDNAFVRTHSRKNRKTDDSFRHSEENSVDVRISNGLCLEPPKIFTLP